MPQTKTVLVKESPFYPFSSAPHITIGPLWFLQANKLIMSVDRLKYAVRAGNIRVTHVTARRLTSFISIKQFFTDKSIDDHIAW